MAEEVLDEETETKRMQDRTSTLIITAFGVILGVLIAANYFDRRAQFTLLYTSQQAIITENTDQSSDISMLKERLEGLKRELDTRIDGLHSRVDGVHKHLRRNQEKLTVVHPGSNQSAIHRHHRNRPRRFTGGDVQHRDIDLGCPRLRHKWRSVQYRDWTTPIQAWRGE